MRSWLIAWLGCFALWMWLVDRPPADEVIAGVLAAAIAASFARLVRREPQSGRMRALRRVPGAAAGSVRDLGLLAGAVWRRGFLRRPERGRIVELPMPEGPTGLTQAIESLGANTIVLGADRERGVLVAHRLVGGDER